jgi:hypothetical protein
VKQAKDSDSESRLQWWWLCWCYVPRNWVLGEKWFFVHSLEPVLGPWLYCRSDRDRGEEKQDYLNTGGSGCVIALMQQCYLNDEWTLEPFKWVLYTQWSYFAILGGNILQAKPPIQVYLDLLKCKYYKHDRVYLVYFLNLLLCRLSQNHILLVNIISLLYGPREYELR